MYFIMYEDDYDNELDKLIWWFSEKPAARMIIVPSE